MISEINLWIFGMSKKRKKKEKKRKKKEKENGRLKEKNDIYEVRKTFKKRYLVWAK